MANYAAYNLVTTGATLIYSPGVAGTATANGFLRGGRERVTVQNLGSNPIYIGDDSSVASTTGLQIPASGVAAFDHPRMPLYGITVTGNQSSPNNTRVFVERAGE